VICTLGVRAFGIIAVGTAAVDDDSAGTLRVERGGKSAVDSSITGIEAGGTGEPPGHETADECLGIGCS
jgi:hypothetical protein